MKTDVCMGLLGCGAYGRVHARVYQADPRVQLKSLWSPTTSRREAAADEFGCRAAGSWEDVVSDPGIDCIAIATPDFAHREYAVAALEAGKHVLLEKPMAMTTADCRAILEARDRSGKQLMVNYHNRWYPAFVAGHDAIAAGRIGKPVCGNLVLSDTITWVETSMKWADRTGPEWFLMSHIADLACWLLNDRPAEVSAFATDGVLKQKGFDTRDLVKATMKMRSGAVVHLESSWILARHWRNPVNDMNVSIQGETGRVDINADHENIALTTDRYETPFVLLNLTEEPPLRAFITCVLEDTPVPVTGEEALLATQVVEAVVLAYSENRIVRFDEVAG